MLMRNSCVFNPSLLTTTSGTAVLLFSRFAKEEALHKRFYHPLGKKAATRYAQRMIDKTRAEASLSGLPLITCFSDEQVGNSFGEKLANSIEGVLKKGYSNVIVIGSDCPSLQSFEIQHAQKLLEKSPLVLGPCSDGGVYLIGISLQAYHRERFINLQWQTSELFNDFRIYAEENSLCVSIVELLNDVDNFQSLLNWSIANKKHALATWVLRQIEVLKRNYIITSRFPFTLVKHSTQHTFRGPPSFTVVTG